MTATNIPNTFIDVTGFRSVTNDTDIMEILLVALATA